MIPAKNLIVTSLIKHNINDIIYDFKKEINKFKTNYYTKSEINNLFNIDSDDGVTITLNDYYTKKETDTLFSNSESKIQTVVAKNYCSNGKLAQVIANVDSEIVDVKKSTVEVSYLDDMAGFKTENLSLSSIKSLQSTSNNDQSILTRALADDLYTKYPLIYYDPEGEEVIEDTGQDCGLDTLYNTNNHLLTKEAAEFLHAPMVLPFALYNKVKEVGMLVDVFQVSLLTNPDATTYYNNHILTKEYADILYGNNQGGMSESSVTELIEKKLSDYTKRTLYDGLAASINSKSWGFGSNIPSGFCSDGSGGTKTITISTVSNIKNDPLVLKSGLDNYKISIIDYCDEPGSGNVDASENVRLFMLGEDGEYTLPTTNFLYDNYCTLNSYKELEHGIEQVSSDLLDLKNQIPKTTYITEKSNITTVSFSNLPSFITIPIRKNASLEIPIKPTDGNTVIFDFKDTLIVNNGFKQNFIFTLTSEPQLNKTKVIDGKFNLILSCKLPYPNGSTINYRLPKNWFVNNVYKTEETTVTLNAMQMVSIEMNLITKTITTKTFEFGVQEGEAKPETIQAIQNVNSDEILVAYQNIQPSITKNNFPDSGSVNVVTSESDDGTKLLKITDTNGFPDGFTQNTFNSKNILGIGFGKDVTNNVISSASSCKNGISLLTDDTPILYFSIYAPATELKEIVSSSIQGNITVCFPSSQKASVDAEADTWKTFKAVSYV